MLGIIYSFGAGLLGAACALAIFTLWRDHQRVTAMWTLLSRPQTGNQPIKDTQTNIEKGEAKK